MKSKLTSIHFIWITILTLFFSSCQVEENAITNDSTSSNYTVKNISADEIASNFKIVEKLEKITSKKSTNTSKNITFTDLGFSIQTDNARYIEEGTYNSYTFSIVQKETENIKNVLFFRNESGDYDAYLVEYDYNKLDLAKFTEDNKPGGFTLKPINLNLNSLTARSVALWVCTYTYGYVNTGELYGAGNDKFEWLVINSNCNTIYSMIEEEDHVNDNNTGSTGGGSNPSGGNGGGKIITSPKGSLYDENELFKISFVKKQLNITKLGDKVFLDNHGAVAFMLYDYLAANKSSEESKSFGIWAINYFRENTNITIDQFENWFMGVSEGQDGEFVNPNFIGYETPLTKQALPSLNQWLTNFPKMEQSGYWYAMSSSEVYKLAGGSLYKSSTSEETKKQYENACAVRGSRALLYSGITIPVLKYGTPPRQVTQKGGDNLNYILSATSFNKFMIDKFGDIKDKLEGDDANNITKITELLRGKSGIYVIVNKDPSKNGAGYSGHVDAIINGSCISNAYTRPKGGILSIRIWSLN